MSTTRFDAITEMATRLAGIQKANGYHTDAGSLVFLGETPTLGPSDPDAALALVVRDDHVRPNQGENVVSTLPVEVQAVVRSSAAGPLVALERVIEDIKRAIETPDRTLAGHLMPRGLERGMTKPHEREAGSEFAGVTVEYVLTFGEKWGAP